MVENPPSQSAVEIGRVRANTSYVSLCTLTDGRISDVML